MKNILKIIALGMLLASLSWGASHNLVYKVQNRLLHLGYDPGPLDGRMGPLTRKAIRAFQHTIGKRSSGRITKALLWELRNAKNSATAGFSQEAEELNGIKDPD